MFRYAWLAVALLAVAVALTVGWRATTQPAHHPNYIVDTTPTNTQGYVDPFLP